MNDVERLVAALRQDFSSPPGAGAPPRAPASCLLDCILSLRRTDERPVAERLEAFERRFPAIEFLAPLRALLASYKSPALFAKDVLELPEPSAVLVLRSLLDYLIKAIDGPGAEVERLRLWAQRARPQDYLTLQIPGLGLGGFQHLRLLLGANTLRPDVAVGRYVAAVIGRPVADVQALRLLEEAAQQARLQLGDLDLGAWTVAAEQRRTAS